MKILYICNEYPPQVHGGIGSFMRDIAESMSQHSQHVEVWGVYHNIEKDTKEYQNGVLVHRIKGNANTGRLNSIKFRLEFLNKLKQFIKENQFDIIEIQEWKGLLPFGLNHSGFVVRLHGAAIFFDKLLNRPGNRLDHIYEKMMLKRSKNKVAVSNFCGKKTLELCGISHQSFHVIYNCVNVKKLESFIVDKFQPFKIVFANSVLRKKGVFELVKSFNSIAKKFPLAELHIIGKLGYVENKIGIKKMLEEVVDQKFKDRLFIRGWLNDAKDVYEELASAHICVYPSHMEGFGIAPLESMAMKKAVIFMNNGPGPEVIENNVSGLLVDSLSPLDITKKIDMVFTDDKLAIKLGEKANERTKKLFDKETVFAKNNLDYYNSII